jgi:hypothetical protein
MENSKRRLVKGASFFKGESQKETHKGEFQKETEKGNS